MHHSMLLSYGHHHVLNIYSTRKLCIQEKLRNYKFIKEVRIHHRNTYNILILLFTVNHVIQQMACSLDSIYRLESARDYQSDLRKNITTFYQNLTAQKFPMYNTEFHPTINGKALVQENHDEAMRISISTSRKIFLASS